MTHDPIAAIRERHAKITKLENEIPLTEYAGPEKSGRVQWELPAHTADVLCRLRNAVPALLTDIDTLLAEITRLQSDVARLTAERDAAAAKERERIVAVLRDEASELDKSRDSALRYHERDIGDRIKSLAAAIARGETEGGDENAR